MQSHTMYELVDKQVEKLNSQGLIIHDYDNLKNDLRIYGYSNLIKSYRDPYMHFDGTTKRYRNGITYEQICSLYLMDKSLRTRIMAAMLDLEEYIKTQLAEVLLCSFGEKQEDYLRFKNFRDRSKPYTPDRFTLEGVLNSLTEASLSGKNPIKYYREKYGNVPPWILLKGVYFGTTINLINSLKSKERDMFASSFYPPEDEFIQSLSRAQLQSLMMDTLYIANAYRNCAAHGGRIYDFDTSSKFHDRSLFTKIPNPHIRGFNLFLFLLCHLQYREPYKSIMNTLNYELNFHLEKYSEDATYLSQYLGVEILLKTDLDHPKSKPK